MTRSLRLALALTVAAGVGLLAPGAAQATTTAPTMSIGAIDLDGPAVVQVPVTVRNRTAKPMRLTEVTFRAPTGWQTRPGARDLGTVKAGASATASFTLRVPERRAGFVVRSFSATATYRGGDGQGSITATRTETSGEAAASVASLYDGVAITDESDPTAGDLDGEGNTLSAQKLAEVGLGRGAAVEALGATLHMPDVAPGAEDNVSAAGQAVQVDATGSKVVLLGTGSSLSAVGTATVVYTDGTSTSGRVGFPNWSFQEADAHGATLVAATKGRNRPSGYGDAAYDYRVFAASLPVDSAKTVDLVILPSAATMKVFDVALAP